MKNMESSATVRLQVAREVYDAAAEDVEYALKVLTQRAGRIGQQIADAREDKPIALDQPEWISQDALKATVAIARYEAARYAYGSALQAATTKES